MKNADLLKDLLEGVQRNLRAAEGFSNPDLIKLRVGMAREYLDTFLAEMFKQAVEETSSP